MGGFFFGGGGASVDLASPGAIGSTTPNTGKFTTLEATTSLQVSTSGFLFGGTNLLEQRNGTSSQSFAIYGTYTDASNYERLRIYYDPSGTAFTIAADRAGTGTARSIQLVTNGAPRLRILPDGTFDSIPSITVNNNVFAGSQYLVGNGAKITFSNGIIYSGDIQLDSQDVVAQRRTTNAQTFRLYNTFTSSTNFERVNFRWASNEFILDAEKGSVGGTLRGVKIGSATTSLLGFYGVTPVDQPATVADPAGGLTVDAEARTAINAIIDRLQELGLIA